MKKNTPVLPENLPRLVAERIHDTDLRHTLHKATHTSLQKRASVVSDYNTWEDMRSLAHDIKLHTIENLRYYLDRFEQKAKGSGAVVHYARDAAEACRIITRIAREVDSSLIVKSKSMTTEEIGLNQALTTAGTRVVETDLGEYIVQLAGELPSHITAPALHMNKKEIGALFARTLGIEYSEDAEHLTQVARDILRQDFLSANLGISGVNFAIAETGSIVIVENEGNARMCSSLPQTHIAVMGFEKLLPDMSSLGLFLNMLGRSATGQRITCYTSVLTGPARQEENDGPRALHIVVLDNGRSAMLADPLLREALLCIRCGACLNVCPVYQNIGGHGYGSIYPGPIGSVISPVFYGEQRAKAMPYASSLCGACSEICPMKIDIHHLLLWWRKSIAGHRRGPWYERLMMTVFAFIANRSWLFDLSGRLARVFSPLIRKNGNSLPVPVWNRTRNFPSLPEKSFKQLWQDYQRERT